MSVIEDLEQNFASLTAEITAKTGRIPKLSGSEKRQVTEEIERHVAEANELIDQIDIEIQSLPHSARQKASSRVKSYRKDIATAEKELRRAQVALYDYEQGRDELMGPDDPHYSEDQRTKLLDNTEKLDRSSRRLDEGYKIALETQEIGNEIMDNLSRDRETITRARERLRDTDTNLSKSGQLLRTILRRMIQNKIIIAIICIVLVAVIITGIYFAVSG
ncbi:vesicle transport through interaction with t-SNAREs homolog 1A-like [Corticium candelabrum]|uniref:vesicle transport through interaction with t-SNAREs homolog 1A-like n=1 Tax=Corticium candelabrum TaxID=121492 RepID=UPI002E26E458|nr:vesicle transport through interaction with t-SNAREs homolog 1A-like [Corticium candelabrum]